MKSHEMSLGARPPIHNYEGGTLGSLIDPKTGNTAVPRLGDVARVGETAPYLFFICDDAEATGDAEKWGQLGSPVPANLATQADVATVQTQIDAMNLKLATLDPDTDTFQEISDKLKELTDALDETDVMLKSQTLEDGKIKEEFLPTIESIPAWVSGTSYSADDRVKVGDTIMRYLEDTVTAIESTDPKTLVDNGQTNIAVEEMDYTPVDFFADKEQLTQEIAARQNDTTVLQSQIDNFEAGGGKTLSKVVTEDVPYDDIKDYLGVFLYPQNSEVELTLGDHTTPFMHVVRNFGNYDIIVRQAGGYHSATIQPQQTYILGSDGVGYSVHLIADSRAITDEYGLLKNWIRVTGQFLSYGSKHELVGESRNISLPTPGGMNNGRSVVIMNAEDHDFTVNLSTSQDPITITKGEIVIVTSEGATVKVERFENFEKLPASIVDTYGILHTISGTMNLDTEFANKPVFSYNTYYAQGSTLTLETASDIRVQHTDGTNTDLQNGATYEVPAGQTVFVRKSVIGYSLVELNEKVSQVVQHSTLGYNITPWDNNTVISDSDVRVGDYLATRATISGNSSYAEIDMDSGKYIVEFWVKTDTPVFTVGFLGGGDYYYRKIDMESKQVTVSNVAQGAVSRNDAIDVLAFGDQGDKGFYIKLKENVNAGKLRIGMLYPDLADVTIPNPTTIDFAVILTPYSDDEYIDVVQIIETFEPSDNIGEILSGAGTDFSTGLNFTKGTHAKFFFKERIGSERQWSEEMTLDSGTPLQMLTSPYDFWHINVSVIDAEAGIVRCSEVNINAALAKIVIYNRRCIPVKDERIVSEKVIERTVEQITPTDTLIDIYEFTMPSVEMGGEYNIPNYTERKNDGYEIGSYEHIIDYNGGDNWINSASYVGSNDDQWQSRSTLQNDGVYAMWQVGTGARGKKARLSITWIKNNLIK